ncbi:uncharacterized protein RAG0_02136 [Rhynchosporium agropyri]|uniref:Uncharacterized protein n=1 Tax=Rhynchosporium agropyri TaxID=914238 RepID=A0A1E1K4P3_9HELO|nr:uncharacterized protein RAG0_02136 [Rhynchosporium agropyri]
MALEILDLHWLFMCSAMSMDTSTVDMIEFCLPACFSDNNIHINKSATNTTKYAYTPQQGPANAELGCIFIRKDT